MSYSRSCTLFALLCALTLASPGVEAGGTTDPAVIKALAAKAYVWGLGPQFIEQSSKYNTIIGAPFNSLKYGFEPAAWNTDATNAGDASVVYVSGFIDFDRNPELVLTVPPSRVSSSSGNQYYVAAYYDAYANTIGSIGTRTTPSDAPTSYLLVGPNSPYANTATANIGGYEYPVVASDTTVNFLLIRILTNTLIDPPDSTSVPNVVTGIVQKFALNSLPEFESADHQPVYPSSFVLPPPTSQQMLEAAPFKNKPTEAVQFFNQLGNAVATNPIPSRDTGLSGTRVCELPAWIVPQYGAPIIYRVPSYGQQQIFDSFAPLGLTAEGFRIPRGWGQAQLQALQEGYCTGQQLLRKFAGQTTSGPLPESDCAGQQIPSEFAGNTTSDANTWTIVNDVIGTYPNNALGYLFRSLIVLEGGVANIPLDAVYPTLGGLNGDNTYKLTFTRPSSVDGAFPVEGIYPPIVGDRVGKLKGF